MRKLVLAILICSVWCSAVSAAEQPLSPALTNDLAAVIHWNGEEAWTAYQKTASYRAFFGSGLAPALFSHFQQIPWKPLLAAYTKEAELPISLDPETCLSVAKNIWSRGLTLGIGGQTRDDGVAPYLVLIVPSGVDDYAGLKSQAEKLEVAETDVAGRKMLRFTGDTYEVACWVEGTDLVIFAGIESNEECAHAEQLVSAPPADRLDQLADWQESWSGEPIPTDRFRSWLNVPKLTLLVKQFLSSEDSDEGLVGVNLALSTLGIDQWRTIAFRAGCHGDHVVRQWSLRAAECPLKLFGWGEKTVSLDQLPPLPADVSSFSLQVVDLAKADARLNEWAKQIQLDPQMVVKFLEQLGLSGATVSVDNPAQTAEIQEKLAAALATLEPAVCLYHDRKQQVLPWGVPTVAIKIKDQAALLEHLKQLESFGWTRDDRWGCPTFYHTGKPIAAQATEVNAAADKDKEETAKAMTAQMSFGTTTLAVCDGWLVGGVQPQMVRTFILRSQGKLPRWSVNSLPAETREKLPPQFARFSYSDPRTGVENLASLAPWLGDGLATARSCLAAYVDVNSILQTAATETTEGVVTAAANKPASPLDIPPVELIIAPLFPNVSVTTVEGTETRQRTYGSTFIDGPIFWATTGYVGLTLLGTLEDFF